MFNRFQSYRVNYGLSCSYIQSLVRSNEQLSKKLGQQLKNQIVILQEYDKLCEELQGCKREKNELYAMCTTLEREVDVLGNKMETKEIASKSVHHMETEMLKGEFETVVQFYKNKNMSQSKLLDTLNERALTLEDEIYSLKDQIRISEKNSDQLIKKLQSFEALTPEKDEKLQELITENTSLSDQLANLLSTLEDRELKEQALMRELIHYKCITREVQDKLDAAVLRIEESTHTAELAMLEKEQCENKIAILEKQVGDLKQLLIVSESKLQIDRLSSHESVVTHLNSKNKVLECDNKNLKLIVNQLKEEIAELKARPGGQSPLAQNKMPEVSTGADRERFLLNKITEIERNSDTFSKQYDLKIKELENLCQQQHQEIERYKRERDSLTVQTADLVKQNSSLADEVNRLVIKNFNTSEELEKQDEEKLNLELSMRQEMSLLQHKLMVQCEDLKSQIEIQQVGYIKDICKLKHQLTLSKAHAQGLLAELEKCKSEYSTALISYKANMEREKCLSKEMKSRICDLKRQIESQSCKLLHFQERVKIQNNIIQSRAN